MAMMRSLVVVVVSACVAGVRAHGYLQEPPARNSMWRFGFDTLHNYNDMGLNCGGFSYQWDRHGGKCGFCGDPYEGPFPHEAGGKFASFSRPISRCYNSGTQSIDVVARITAYHMGYFEFRLCVNNDMTSDPGQDCVDNGLLLNVTDQTKTTGISYRYDINPVEQESYTFKLDLPQGVECSQCILHWKYNTGNNWGCEDGECGIGLGPSEQFVNCADIAIMDDCSSITTVDPNKVTVITPSLTPYTGTTRGPPVTSDATTSGPTTSGPKKKVCPPRVPITIPGAACEALGVYADVPGMVDWCLHSCFDDEAPHCPSEQCLCTAD